MFVSLLAALLVTPAHGKDACAGYKVQKDEFGGGSQVVAMAQGLSQFTAVAMVFEAKSGVGELSMITKEGGAVSGSVAAGVEIPLKLEDGTILALKTVREAATKPYVSNDSVMTMVPYALGLDVDSVAKLAASPIVAARIPTSQGPWDWKPNKGVQKSVIKAATCMKEHVTASASPAAAPLAAPI